MEMSLPLKKYLLPLFKGHLKIGRQLVCDIRTPDGSKQIVKIKTGNELIAIYLFINYFRQFYTREVFVNSIKMLIKDYDSDFIDLVSRASKANFEQSSVKEIFEALPIISGRHLIVSCDYSVEDINHSFSATLRQKTIDGKELFCCYWLLYSLGMVGENDLLSMYDEFDLFEKNK